MIDTVLAVVVIAGCLAMAALAARHPAFWTGLVLYVIAYVNRMSPEQEAEFQRSIRQGREWDPFRKRARDK